MFLAEAEAHIFLFVISVDRVHRSDAGQVPTLQESVSSYKQIIHYTTLLSPYAIFAFTPFGIKL